MLRDPSAGRSELVRRGLRKRCPRCGARPFRSFFELSEDCPGCGHHFEREDGYWAGALIINTILTFGLFIVVFVGGVALTWPDVPWTAVMVVTITVNSIIPIWFYPRSKTTWAALELSWHPLEPDEITQALERSLNPPSTKY